VAPSGISTDVKEEPQSGEGDEGENRLLRMRKGDEDEMGETSDAMVYDEDSVSLTTRSSLELGDTACVRSEQL
jgi:hypothetical protein